MHNGESPLLFAEHLHPGLFVAAVGADNPAKQEIDAAALSRSRVVVDSLAACVAGGDLHHAIKANVMTEQDVHDLLVRFRVPEPLLVLGAGLVGLALSRVAPWESAEWRSKRAPSRSHISKSPFPSLPPGRRGATVVAQLKTAN